MSALGICLAALLGSRSGWWIGAIVFTALSFSLVLGNGGGGAGALALHDALLILGAVSALAVGSWLAMYLVEILAGMETGGATLRPAAAVAAMVMLLHPDNVGRLADLLQSMSGAPSSGGMMLLASGTEMVGAIVVAATVVSLALVGAVVVLELACKWLMRGTLAEAHIPWRGMRMLAVMAVAAFAMQAVGEFLVGELAPTHFVGTTTRAQGLP